MPRCLALLFAPLTLALAPEAAAQPTQPGAAAAETAGAFVEAIAKQWRGDHEEALQALERVLVAAPEDAAVFDALAESHAALGQAPEALLAAEEAARRAPAEPSFLRRLASARLATDDASGAAEALERVVALRPAAVGALATLVEVYADLGRDAEAVRTLARLVEVGETPAARVRLAAYARASGDAPEAARHLARAAALAPDEPAIARALADALDASGDAAGARRALARFLARNPQDPSARAALAARGGAGDAPEASGVGLPAEDALRRARDLYSAADEDPDGLDSAEALLAPLVASGDPAVLALAGRVAFRQGRYGPAADRLTRALDADPRDVEAWALALRALARSGAPEAARTADDAMLLLGADPDVASGAAEALVAAGQPAAALRAAPETPDGHALRALALADLGRAPEAADALAAAVGAEPALLAAAEAALASGAAARAAWERAAALDPGNAWIGARR